MFLFYLIFWFLGLPDRIEFGPSKRIENVYDAEGLKLIQRLINGTSTIQTDYMGEAIYRNDTLISIAHDEGYSVPLDDNNTAFMPRFFYKDHLGNTRLIYSVAPNGAYMVQETHYGPYGEMLEGIGQTATELSDRWKFLYQGKEYVDAFGLNMYDFGWRMGDSWAGRWPSIDPADQFQSMTGYGYMANNPVSLTDPDGRFVPLAVYAGAALVGGAINLYSNWGKIKDGDWRAGAAYFVSGAVGGAVSVTNPFSGGAVTGAANATIDVLTGNFPDMKNESAVFNHIAGNAITGAVSSRIGASVGVLVGPYLQGVFKWTQSTFVNTTRQTIMIGNQAYTYFLDVGVKLSKSLFQSVGGTVGKVVGKGKLGDLTKAEIHAIQKGVNVAGRPLEVAGSAAKGTRNGIGLDAPFQKGIKSDIDYLAHPSSIPYFEGIKLPGIDKGGIIPGLGNPYQGPIIRFDPFSTPTYHPFIPFGH